MAMDRKGIVPFSIAQSHLPSLKDDTRAQESLFKPLGAFDLQVVVSIVIVNWNTKDLLRNCLVSIPHEPSVEIIVVDNGSFDESVKMVANDYPSVRLITNARNMGFAAANNQGLSHARGQYLLLLNSDTVLLPGALEEMVHYMDAHPRVGALGPRLLNEDRSPQLSVYPFPRALHDALVILQINRWPLVGNVARWYGQHRDTRMSAQTTEVDWIMGACLMLRRQALEEVGALDEGYFFNTEDVDLCYRLYRRGWPTVFLPSAEVIHLGGQSWAHMSATRLVWTYTMPLRYYRLHHTTWQFLMLRFATALAAIGHMLTLLMKRKPSPDRHLYLAAYARVLARSIVGR